jgi:hypothetical protein
MEMQIALASQSVFSSQNPKNATKVTDTISQKQNDIPALICLLCVLYVTKNEVIPVRFTVTFLCILTTFQKLVKLRLLNQKIKNLNGTHHAVFAYNKFQVQLSEY